jgi:hypothetical protein
MADDSERIDPKGTLETVPPPHGAKDPYSAQTRVGTLPEHVLEAMRQQETDASIERRTKSGMQASAARPPAKPLAAPPLPTFAAAAPSPPPLPLSRLSTPRSVRPSGQHRVQPLPSLPRPSPLSPLALDAPSIIATPQEGWLTGASASPMTGMTAMTPSTPITPAAVAPAIELPAVRSSVGRSLLVIAFFALLGGLLAAAITLAGY